MVIILHSNPCRRLINNTVIMLLLIFPSLIAQVWRVDGQEKILLQASDQSKFYSGDCYIFQYSYPGDDKEEYLIGTWFGKKSVEVNFSHILLTLFLPLSLSLLIMLSNPL